MVGKPIFGDSSIRLGFNYHLLLLKVSKLALYPSKPND